MALPNVDLTLLYQLIIEKRLRGAEEMYGLAVKSPLAGMPEDLGLIPSTHMVAQSLYLPSLRI